MPRRSIVVALGIAWGLLAGGDVAHGGPPGADGPARWPNVVFILADDLGAAELGCYGQRKIRTPHADRLAAEGMRFTRFYAGSPVCAPSRCALLTGKHSGHGFVRDNREIQPEGQIPLPAGEVTLAEALRARGYATGAVGKWGLGPPGSEGDPLAQGFGRFFGYNCQRHAHNHYPTYLWDDRARVELAGNPGGATGRQYAHDRFEAEALRFLDEHRTGPFFLFLPFTIPHAAIQVPDDALAEYRGLWDDPAYDGKKGYQPHPAPRAGYAAMVTRLDRTVGRVMERLRELGIDGDTVVFFSSDNGPTFDVGGADSKFFESAGGLRGLKGSVYEGGIRVPLVARWPGRIAAGATSDHVGYFPDVLPTLLDLAGPAPDGVAEAAPAGVDGLSFAPTLLGRPEGQARHEFLYWEFASSGGQQAVRLGPWKGVRPALGKGQTRVELYDLDADPAETTDVAAAHPDVVRRVEEVMRREHAPSRTFPLPTVDPKATR